MRPIFWQRVSTMCLHLYAYPKVYAFRPRSHHILFSDPLCFRLRLYSNTEIVLFDADGLQARHPSERFLATGRESLPHLRVFSLPCSRECHSSLCLKYRLLVRRFRELFVVGLVVMVHLDQTLTLIVRSKCVCASLGYTASHAERGHRTAYSGDRGGDGAARFLDRQR